MVDRTSSTKKVSTAQIQVYPNPTSDQITIASGDFTGQSATLYSATGQVITTSAISGPNHTIDISDVPAGFYVLSVGEYRAKILKQYVSSNS